MSRCERCSRRRQVEPAPDEVTGAQYPEGAVHRVTVNAYERNASARRACIAHYGCRCAVCGLDLSERYGKAAIGLIHVHHLVPIAEVGADYSVDPIADLRPVCPNCHAVIHRREPPYEPADVAMMLRATFRSAPTTTSTRGP